jgi:hypothetical protein
LAVSLRRKPPEDFALRRDDLIICVKGSKKTNLGQKRGMEKARAKTPCVPAYLSVFALKACLQIT